MGLNVVHPADAEMRLGPVKIRILEDGTHTDHRLGIVEVTLQPHSAATPQHSHPQHDETFYVVAGTMTFISGSAVIDAKPGTLITVPPETAHTFVNNGDVPAVLLGTVTPALYIDYFRQMMALPVGPSGGIDPAAAAAVMARFGTKVSIPTA